MKNFQKPTLFGFYVVVLGKICGYTDIIRQVKTANGDMMLMDEMEEEIISITDDDFKEFLSAKSYDEQFRILLAHAEKNQKIIENGTIKKGDNK